MAADFPVAETLWQITPWNAGTISEENRLDEQSIIRRRAADMLLDPAENP